MAVAGAIMGGERPPRPTHSTLTDELWELMQRCWAQDPRLRPEMSQVVRDLHGQLAPPCPTIRRLLTLP